MVEQASVDMLPWQQLEQVVDSGNAEHLAMFVQLLPPGDVAYTIHQLPEAKQTQLFESLTATRPELAADLVQHFSDDHAADLIEELTPESAAAILDEMPSDDQADVLAEMDEQDAHAILERMDPEEAQDARDRLQYAYDTAGGLMMTEFLAYHERQLVDDVIADLRAKVEEDDDLEVRYLYVTDDDGRLAGVVKLRNLVLAAHNRRLTSLMVRNPQSVTVDAHLDEIADLFDRFDFSVMPVRDHEDRLVGIVQERAVNEALGERSGEDLLKFGGIIGGEELRSMPLRERTLRRMAFLMPNVLLSFFAASIIAYYEPVIDKVTSVAVFLPMIANLSGAAGNQAVAVSIRELALGLVRPVDWVRICIQEIWVGLFNGVAIGLMLAGIAFAMYSNLPALALIVLMAYILNSMFSVMIGGSIPLILKRMKLDPAMASSPLLTTMTDMASFFLTLTFTAFFFREVIAAG